MRDKEYLHGMGIQPDNKHGHPSACLPLNILMTNDENKVCPLSVGD